MWECKWLHATIHVVNRIASAMFAPSLHHLALLHHLGLPGFSFLLKGNPKACPRCRPSRCSPKKNRFPFCMRNLHHLVPNLSGFCLGEKNNPHNDKTTKPSFLPGTHMPISSKTEAFASFVASPEPFFPKARWRGQTCESFWASWNASKNPASSPSGKTRHGLALALDVLFHHHLQDGSLPPR